MEFKFNSNPIWTTTPLSEDEKILENGMALNHGKTWSIQKELDQGRKNEAWGKSQRSEKKKKEEMKIIPLSNKKNVWAFFCHMDYCKD